MNFSDLSKFQISASSEANKNVGSIWTATSETTFLSAVELTELDSILHGTKLADIQRILFASYIKE